MWIYHYNKWPDFSWDAQALSTTLAAIRHQQGLLIGKMEGLGFELRQETSLQMLTSEVVKSSAIEGEHLNREEVRSSIASRLGMPQAGMKAASRDVEGVVEMMLDATQRAETALSKDRLFGWHNALFPTGYSGMYKIRVGDWRQADKGPMRVVSGAMGQERVHFEAPAAEVLSKEMKQFLVWFNKKPAYDPVLKAGVAHLWFVTLHPFDDGSGRIARAIADMALARADGVPERFYSMSTQIEKERKEYYKQLEAQQRGTTDITDWLLWFLDCLGRSLSRANKSVSKVLLKAELWTKVNASPVNERQRDIINRMLQEDFKGHMNTSKYAKLLKCSNDTALRDITQLRNRGVFIQNEGGGRSTSYRLASSKKEVAMVT